MKIKSLGSKLLDVLICFSMIVAMIIIAIVFIGAMKSWVLIYSGVLDFNGQMFWFALLFAIAYTMYGWLVKFANEFATAYKSLRRKNGI